MTRLAPSQRDASGEVGARRSPRLAARDYIGRGQTFRSIGDDIADIAFSHPMRRRWLIAFAGALGLVGILVVSLGWLFFEGVGIWANNVPVTWALDIVSYDWWIGAASGSLFVSAAFLLIGAEWRSAVNRITETLALVAAAAAAVYPIVHLGRPWFFYWNLPYPNTLALWPQFRSPLFWDAVDIISFLGTAIVFWFIGMVPDLATLRDQAVTRIQPDGKGTFRAQLYGIAALGWRGSAMHWLRWMQAYRIVAMFGVVLVVSLQCGAAVMFAGSVEPGWHDTMLPIHFVLAAIFEGVAFAAVVVVILRVVFDLEAFITPRHLNAMAVMLLILGLANLYCYGAEMFATLLGGDAYDAAVLHRRIVGPHAWAFWTMILASLVPVQLFWLTAVRTSGIALVLIGTLVAIGTFGDHFMVIVVTLQHDFLPSSSHPYSADLWGVATFVGSIGLFVALILLAFRYLPLLSIVGTKGLAQRAAGRQA